MKWLRLYTEVLHDPKVQTLDPARFRGWINLLMIANENVPRGTLPDIDRIAFLLRTSQDEARAILVDLTFANLLDVMADGTLRPHNWDVRQPESDNAVARMRVRRALNKASATRTTIPLETDRADTSGELPDLKPAMSEEVEDVQSNS
jgi:hypothetical protein